MRRSHRGTVPRPCILWLSLMQQILMSRPGERAQRDREGGRAPDGEHQHLPPEDDDRLSVGHDRAQRVVESRERKQVDERLHGVRKCAEEKKTPEATNIGSIIAFIIPESVSLFSVRDAQST